VSIETFRRFELDSRAAAGDRCNLTSENWPPGRNLNRAENICILCSFLISVGIDTPQNTPSRMWLLPDVVGCSAEDSHERLHVIL
jgi:hypothetical protein